MMRIRMLTDRPRFRRNIALLFALIRLRGKLARSQIQGAYLQAANRRDREGPYGSGYRFGAKLRRLLRRNAA
jgi:hypothetical protein